ncbi:uncharacterized protein LOC129949471 [Eupeodes corollae]|uniref:uncharacterized protein LOC129949471 n=1 Tax=Eupeodes corollae TaxID=290404 RepID=UPI002490494F|nr:uncharacterized protein LOC129949471 [Eupeodes corollae]
MAKETMIVFVYDTEYCKDETHDPINAVLYFHPSWVSDIQKVALCGQLMGTSQFLKHCFFRPKIISLQNGKFVFREFGRFVVAIGTDRNISDYLLEHRANLLASLVGFFHRDLQTIYDQFPSNKHHRNVSEKLYHIFGTYLPILQYNGNIFQNVPKLRIPKIASNIFLDAMHTLQNCQQTKGVLGGAILYHNKIVVSQLSDSVTKNIVFTDPHRIRSTAEMITVNFHVPVGVQMIFVYIPVDHFNKLSADAYRSQTLQTQHLSNNAMQNHFQKRKMKRDRSIIFSNIPEEHSSDQIEHVEPTVVKTKKIALRPTHLPLQEVIPKDLKENEKPPKDKNHYPEYIGRTSVCSTPMTENKILHGNGIMSICANPNEDSNASKTIRSSFKIDFDKMFSKFVNNSENMERRNSFTDLQDSVKKISRKFSLKKTLSSYKMDLSSPSSERSETMLRATSDPMQSNLSDNDTLGSIFDQFLREYRKDSKKKTEQEEAVELVEDTIQCSKNPTAVQLDLNNIQIECASDIDKNQLPKKHEFKTPLDKKALSLPLKTHSDFQAENVNTRSTTFERRRMSGIQLTPLMAKLSVLAFTDETHTGYNRRDSLQGLDYTIPSVEKCGGKTNVQKDLTSTDTMQHSNEFQKVELYICGQQNMTMFLLLEKGSTQKQEIVQTMFDKCVAKLGKMESHLYQTLNVNMMEGVSEGIYSLICLDSKWDTVLNHGPWTPLDQSFLEHMRIDLSTGQLITDIFLRTGDCILYGYKSGRTEFFFKESAHYFTGIPPPSDPMGTIAKRAKSRLEEDFSIVLF